MFEAQAYHLGDVQLFEVNDLKGSEAKTDMTPRVWRVQIRVFN